MNGQKIADEQCRHRAEERIEGSPYREELSLYYNSMLQRKTPHTVDAYIHHTALFLETVGKPVGEITEDDCIAYLNHLLSKSSSYRVAIYAALRGFSKYLYSRNRIPRDFMLNVERPEYKETQEQIEKREKGFLTESEVRRNLHAVATGVGSVRAKNRQEPWRKRDMAICMLLIGTGMRCGALYKLDVADVHLDTRTVMVTDKGQNAHLLPLPAETVTALAEWMDDRQQKLGGLTETALFISNQGKRLSISAISDIVEKYSAGIIKNKKVTPHKYRATFGTNLYRKTHDINFVQAAMCHKNPSTTSLYIRGQQKERMERTAAIMSQVLSGTT